MTQAKPVHPLTIIGITILFLGLIFAVYLSPQPGQTVAVVALPMNGVSASRVVARAGGDFQDMAFSGRILLARSSSPQFITRLYANGAVLVFNPRILTGCRSS